MSLSMPNTSFDEPIVDVVSQEKKRIESGLGGATNRSVRE
jgi:hypothetical protein